MTTISSPSKPSSNANPLDEGQVKTHTQYWLNDSLTADQVTHTLPVPCIDELDAALRQSKGNDSPALDEFPHCLQFIGKLHVALGPYGPGILFIDRFPVERYNESENRWIWSTFSSMMGPLMRQNHAGLTLYDVKDTQPDDPTKARKSITNRAQPFHTDGGWHTTPAHFIGLFCLNNASQGGGSMATSLACAYDKLATANPEVIRVLGSPLPWDKQGEHAIDEPEVEHNPVFGQKNGQFFGRYYESYVRNGYKKLGQCIPKEIDQALTVLQTTLEKQQSVKFMLQPGQAQYVNNWNTVHARAEFVDTCEVTNTVSRHLIRVWNHSAN